MNWKIWVIFGLTLQFLAVIPAALLALLPERVHHNHEFGLITALEKRAGRTDWVCVLSGFLLIGFGAACQAVGVVLSL